MTEGLDEKKGRKDMDAALVSRRFQGGYTVTEAEIQRHFFENLDTYLPGAEVASGPGVQAGDRRGIPDGWVTYQGKLCPVEVKQRRFGTWALDQLLGYLSTYNCQNGIAVCEHFAYPARHHQNVTYVTVPVDRTLEKVAPA